MAKLNPNLTNGQPVAMRQHRPGNSPIPGVNWKYQVQYTYDDGIVEGATYSHWINFQYRPSRYAIGKAADRQFEYIADQSGTIPANVTNVRYALVKAERVW